MKKGFADAQDILEKRKQITYDPMIVFGLENLVEMLAEEELRAEQSQIAEAFCREHHIPFAKLPPAQARAKQLPRVLPLSTGDAGTSRIEILGGIQRLAALNPVLDLYTRLKDRIALELTWQL